MNANELVQKALDLSAQRVSITVTSLETRMLDKLVLGENKIKILDSEFTLARDGGGHLFKLSASEKDRVFNILAKKGWEVKHVPEKHGFFSGYIGYTELIVAGTPQSFVSAPYRTVDTCPTCGRAK